MWFRPALGTTHFTTDLQGKTNRALASATPPPSPGSVVGGHPPEKYEFVSWDLGKLQSFTKLK